jgi:hypothetical protein
MNNKKENKMTYTTNDVRFQYIPKRSDSQEAKDHNVHNTQAAINIWGNVQMLWNQYYADGKPIDINPNVYIGIVTGEDDDDDMDQTNLASASPPVQLGEGGICKFNINVERGAEISDIFSALIHELAHIYDFMTGMQDQKTFAKRMLDYQKQMQRFLETKDQQPMDPNDYIDLKTWAIATLKYSLATARQYISGLDGESAMIDIVKQKLPNLYTEHDSYVLRFSAAIPQFTSFIRSYNEMAKADGGPLLTRQFIEKKITPVARTLIPNELWRVWDNAIYTLNSQKGRGFAYDQIGKPNFVKNEGDTAGYDDADVQFWFKSHKNDYIFYVASEKINESDILQQWWKAAA